MSRRGDAIVRIGRPMRFRRPAICARAVLAMPIAAAALVLGACEREEPDVSAGAGGSSSQGDAGASREIPGDADPADARVIDEWARTLKRGDLDAAADYFALPSVAENGPILLRIRDHADAVAFNASLPCGARLIEATTEAEFVVATFRLGERPGPGSCGSGTGETAQTAFVIRGGEIVEWRRVGIGDQQAPSQSV